MATNGIKVNMTPSHPGDFIRTEVIEELGLNVTVATHRRMELERVRSERDPRPRGRPVRFRAGGADPWNAGPFFAAGPKRHLDPRHSKKREQGDSQVASTSLVAESGYPP